jgi:hypothetical protein
VGRKSGFRGRQPKTVTLRETEYSSGGGAINGQGRVASSGNTEESARCNVMRPTPTSTSDTDGRFSQRSLRRFRVGLMGCVCVQFSHRYAKVSGKRAACVYRTPEDGGSLFLRNVGRHIPDYTAIHPGRNYCENWHRQPANSRAEREPLARSDSSGRDGSRAQEHGTRSTGNNDLVDTDLHATFDVGQVDLGRHNVLVGR